ncbi:hypothetical protein AVEN_126865-1 [Araneus ventricosus]|uniref:Uncharacterized protein n=1 Tax=Araneus ventricosus TaxID=182803 RepID=A0A4Y2C1F1_ARAVE|nr:hypothetical protein AVEN_126865-1 [Araneus ventricosus]
MRISLTSAHSKYRLFLEEQRAKEIAVNDSKERKLESNFLITLQKKRSLLEKEIAEMEYKVNELAEEARDFSLLTKSNKMRKAISKITEQLKELKL